MVKIVGILIVFTLLICAFFTGVYCSDPVKKYYKWLLETEEVEQEITNHHKQKTQNDFY